MFQLLFSPGKKVEELEMPIPSTGLMETSHLNIGWVLASPWPHLHKWGHHENEAVQVDPLDCLSREPRWPCAFPLRKIIASFNHSLTVVCGEAKNCSHPGIFFHLSVLTTEDISDQWDHHELLMWWVTFSRFLLLCHIRATKYICAVVLSAA